MVDRSAIESNVNGKKESPSKTEREQGRKKAGGRVVWTGLGVESCICPETTRLKSLRPLDDKVDEVGVSEDSVAAREVSARVGGERLEGGPGAWHLEDFGRRMRGKRRAQEGVRGVARARVCVPVARVLEQPRQISARRRGRYGRQHLCGAVPRRRAMCDGQQSAGTLERKRKTSRRRKIARLHGREGGGGTKGEQRGREKNRDGKACSCEEKAKGQCGQRIKACDRMHARASGVWMGSARVLASRGRGVCRPRRLRDCSPLRTSLPIAETSPTHSIGGAHGTRRIRCELLQRENGCR